MYTAKSTQSTSIVYGMPLPRSNKKQDQNSYYYGGQGVMQNISRTGEIRLTYKMSSARTINRKDAVIILGLKLHHL